MSLDLLIFLVIVLVIVLNRIPGSTPRNSKSCICCGKLTTLRCSRCHEAYYCSPAHMTADWTKHKTVCRKSSRPVLEALLFPVDDTAPVLVKIPYTCKVDTDRLQPTPYDDLDTQTLRRFLRGLEMKYVSRLGSNGPLLEKALVVMYGSEFQVDGSPQNRCIAGLTGSRMAIPWAGNVLVLRQRGAPIFGDV
ncbi:hypothetical protein B0H15DRAFT_935239 [Mycena belliarum]|uniref:MYND-type domain-containing protein n=1 Tax=Mycena belliarum TaxID=1033014 RepID=A0AAD6XL96_9AGAR|nr:hypothetical protein B0H15DRAFT_935239 [Mycena belliae]